jgi:hypothetical protein
MMVFIGLGSKHLFEISLSVVRVQLFHLSAEFSLHIGGFLYVVRGIKKPVLHLVDIIKDGRVILGPSVE